MKVRLPVVIKDTVTSRYLEMDPFEEFFYETDDVFLDGPVTRRVAVLDFDPKDGTLSPPVPFQPPGGRRNLGRYQLREGADIHAVAFMKVSVFATVLRTMRMFEEPDTLGRPLTWAFDARQLLIVPRAGEWTNAYYERDSHSLQFFYFPSSHDPEQWVYTSLPHDIVSHETGHAILDGIAPDLYNAVTPQSLALHEAVADLVALLMAFRSGKLSRAVLAANRGSIDDTEAFSGIAEEFAMARDPTGRRIYLRNLRNDKNLDPDDRHNGVARDDPHALSEVLGGTLYAVMLRIHGQLRSEIARKEGIPEYSASGKALALAAERFKRMILRALDYLPPGEVSFADYGRAIIAADQASHPKDGRERRWIVEEFVRRKIVPRASALKVRTNDAADELARVNLETLVESDWAAYEFANRNRAFLGIPPGIPFRVCPRLDVTKCDYQAEGERLVRECLFKVSWDRKENNRVGRGLPRARQVTFGTTLAIDWERRTVRARLTSDPGAVHRRDRDAMLSRLAADDLIRFVDEANGPDGRPLLSVLRAESIDGLMRLRGTARMLHIIGESS